MSLKKQGKMAPVLEALPTTRKTWREPQALGFQPGQALAVLAIQGVNQEMEYISLSISPTLPIILSFNKFL